VRCARRLFVWFSDDRGLELVVWFGFAVFILLVIIVVWVSWRHHGDNAATNQVETFSEMRAVMSAPVGRHDVPG
jgi:hypothetical protein